MLEVKIAKHIHWNMWGANTVVGSFSFFYRRIGDTDEIKAIFYGLSQDVRYTVYTGPSLGEARASCEDLYLRELAELLKEVFDEKVLLKDAASGDSLVGDTLFQKGAEYGASLYAKQLLKLMGKT